MKFRLLGVVAGALLALAPGAASAADVATLGCVRAEMSPELVARVQTAARQKMLGEQGAPASGDVRADVAAAGERCRKKNGWSDQALSSALVFTVAGIGREVIEQSAASRGIKLIDVRAMIAELTAETREGLLQSKPEAIDAYVAALRKRGVDTNNMELVKIYGSLAVLVTSEMQGSEVFAAS